jgi:PKD repeat protein
MKMLTILLIAAAGLALGVAPSAQATTTNVVPNPGFEQGGCGEPTPVICGWFAGSESYIEQGSPRSGSASMYLFGEFGASATSGCVAIGPGIHAASYWFGGSGVDGLPVELVAYFYSEPDCGGLFGGDGISGWSNDGGWHEVSGSLTAPPGTVSGVFIVQAWGSLCCPEASANFDDLYVEAEALPPRPETTITSGPSGTTNSTSATFEFTASEPASFECSLDAQPSSACSSPVSYSSLSAGSHTFRVRAIDLAGNADPTPAERTWIVNASPTAAFTISCTGLNCSFDGGGSSDSDGTIVSYLWDFGDGATGSGVTAQHTYSQASTYTVSLTVTDNAGASAVDSKTVVPITLTAQRRRVKSSWNVDLSWSAATDGVDVYRNGVRIATVQASSYTDDLGKSRGTFIYGVCALALPVCSNNATVTL